jgi:hypothetical protein
MIVRWDPHLYVYFLSLFDMPVTVASQLAFFKSTECLRIIPHVLAEALDEIHLRQIFFNEVADLRKRLRLVRCRHCHDTMKMWCIIPLVLGRATNRFSHCVCASEDTGVVAEFVLAWDDTSCLVHGLKAKVQDFIFVALGAVKTHEHFINPRDS